MTEKYILGIDQGTTRTKAVIFNAQAKQVALGVRELPNIFQDQDGLNRTLK